MLTPLVLSGEDGGDGGGRREGEGDGDGPTQTEARLQYTPGRLPQPHPALRGLTNGSLLVPFLVPRRQASTPAVPTTGWCQLHVGTAWQWQLPAPSTPGAGETLMGRLQPLSVSPQLKPGATAS